MLLYFEPMLRGPESEFHFDPEKKWFTTTPLVDPTTGVVTEWEKKIGDVVTWLVRIDRFPHGPRRRVAHSEYSFGEGSTFSKIEYSFSDVAGDTEREIRLCQNPNFADLSLSFHIFDGQEASLFFYAQYTAEGVLKDFSLSFTPKSSSEMLSDLSLVEKIDYFEGRSFEDNLKELVQIFEMRGEGVLWKSIDSDEEGIQESQRVHSYFSQKKLSKWPPDIIREANQAIFLIIGMTSIRHLRSEYLEGNLSNEQIETFISALTPQVLKCVFDDSERSHKRDEFLVRKALSRVVAELLAWYYENLKLTGEIEIKFDSKNEDDQQFSVSVFAWQEKGNKPLTEDQVVFGEAYHFEEYSYIIEKTENKMWVLRRSRLDPSRQDKIIFPVSIPPEVFEALKTEESVGWERVFELVGMDYTAG